MYYILLEFDYWARANNWVSVQKLKIRPIFGEQKRAKILFNKVFSQGALLQVLERERVKHNSDTCISHANPC